MIVPMLSLVAALNTQPKDSDYVVIKTATMHSQIDPNEVGLVMIENGQFDCKESEHRAFIMLNTEDLTVVVKGCATLELTEDYDIKFENGQEIKIK